MIKKKKWYLALLSHQQCTGLNASNFLFRLLLEERKKQTLLNADSTGLVEKNVLTGKWQTTKLLKSQTWERNAVS